VITAATNPKLKLVRKLLTQRRKRQELGLFAVEGEDLVAAAQAGGIEPVELLVAGETVVPELLAGLSTLPHPTRAIGVFRTADLPRGARETTLALWRVADPGNVGTLLRAADAFAPAFVSLSRGCADPTGAKALRASAGAVFRVPLGDPETAPRPWIGLAAGAGTPIDVLDRRDRGTFVLGAEREGLPADLLHRCDQVVRIPQSERVESLNVAMAGTIALWEWARRR